MSATAEARARIAEEQSALVRALVAHGPVPPRFDAERVRVAAVQLEEKRKMALKKVWPGLAHGLGAAFGGIFDVYAKDHPHPEYGHGLADGLGFARWLARSHRLPDEGKLELLDVELRTVQTRGRLRARRGFAVGAAVISAPRRIAFGACLPWVGARVLALGSPYLAHRWLEKQAKLASRRDGAAQIG